MELIDELLQLGFTPSVARVIAASGVIETIEDLRSRPWGETAEGDGLMRQLLMARNVDRRLVNQVAAFRVCGDPRARLPGPVSVKVELDADLAQALDAWISAQPTPLSRPRAIRAMVSAALAITGRPA